MLLREKVAEIESYFKYSKLHCSTHPFVVTYKLLIACDPGLTCIGVNSLCQGWGKVMYVCIIYDICFFLSFKFASGLMHFWVGPRLVSLCSVLFVKILGKGIAVVHGPFFFQLVLSFGLSCCVLFNVRSTSTTTRRRRPSGYKLHVLGWHSFLSFLR